MPTYACLSGTGGVASQIHLASIEGLKILEKGGNAFDAAITTSSVLTVLLPNTGSAGGDGFLLATQSNDELIAYNGSGKSPRELSAEEYLTEKPIRGPLTVTVPGLIDLWDWASANYGSMDLDPLLGRAISLAREGFHVQEPLARAVESNKRMLTKYEGWNKVFGWMEAGSKTHFPRMAAIYRAVARRGADAFYRSPLTEDLVNELRQYKVPITYEDFSEHRGERTTPIKCEYNDYEVHELPPNTQGISTLQLLKAIEVTELTKLPLKNPERIEKFFKLAAAVYHDRDRYVADPDHYQPPVDKLLSLTYLKEKLHKKYSSQGQLNPNDTTFLVTADKHGNLVGFIQSIFHGFGSGIVAHDIPFQNRGAGFTKSLGVPNSPAPRKRPLHTLSILLARHGTQGHYMIGCAGGDLRPQIHAEILMNAVDYDMPLSRAVDTPRYILTRWGKRQTEAIVEDGAWTRDLPAWTTRIRYPSSTTGIVQAAKKGPNGMLEFVADPRGGGIAACIL